MGARLAQAGHDVSLIARGSHLQAIQENGLALVDKQESQIVRNLAATHDMTELNHQNLVIMSLKAHQISSVVHQLPSIVGPDTSMVTVQNGIPWWYFQKFGGKHEGRVVESVDPGGILAEAINPECLIGCIAYPAAVISEPGVIYHVEGNRFPVGELDGSHSERVVRVAEVLAEAGFKSPVLDDIRSEIWLKLWGNLSFNPISALTHATLEGICQFPLSHELASSMMIEAKDVAEKLGASFRVSLEKRIEGAERVGKHKTSMLQDVESGKPLEIDGVLGAVIELADVVKVEVPTLKAVYACVRLLDHTLQSENIRLKGRPKAT